jgi:hypothetical protein
MRPQLVTLVLVALGVSTATAGQLRGKVVAKVDGKTLRSAYAMHIGAVAGATGPVGHYNVLSAFRKPVGEGDDERSLVVSFAIAPGARGAAQCSGLQYSAPVSGAFNSGEWTGTSCEVLITRNAKHTSREGPGQTTTVARRLAGRFSGTIPHREGTPGGGDVTISGRFRTRLFVPDGPKE